MQVLSITIPIFLIIAAGYILRRKGVITLEIKDFLSRFVYYAAFPALTFRSIVSFDFSRTLNMRLVGANLATTAAMFIMSFAAVLLVRDARKRGALHMGCFRSNQGYLGLPVINGFYGAEAMSRAAVVNGFDSPLAILLSAIALETYGPGCKGSRFRAFLTKLAGLAANPIVLSAMLGLLLSCLQVPVLKFGMLDQLLALLGGTSLPLALLSIGCSIEIRSIRNNLRPVLAVIAAKLLLMPLLGFLLSWFVFKLRGTDLGVNVILTAMPSSVSSYIMACEMETDADLMASIIGISTFMSILSISIIQWVLQTM
jgi:malate permease and related proteins